MLGTQRSPLPSSPPSPLLLTSSSGADHPSPPLRTPSSVTFPCSCFLLPQISGIDCALDSSGPVRQTRHMSWRAATSSTSAVVRDRDRPTRLRRARCGWRPGNRRQGECDGKSPLVSHHEGSRGGGKKTDGTPSLEKRRRRQVPTEKTPENDTAQSNIRFCCSTVHRTRVPDSLCPSPL